MDPEPGARPGAEPGAGAASPPESVLDALSKQDIQSLSHQLRRGRDTAAKRQHGKQPLPFLHERCPVDICSKDKDHLSACLALLDRLPANSAYTSHRRKVIMKAISMLR